MFLTALSDVVDILLKIFSKLLDKTFFAEVTET